MSTCFWDQDLLEQPKLSRNSTLGNLPQRPPRTCSQTSQSFCVANIGQQKKRSGSRKEEKRLPVSNSCFIHLCLDSLQTLKTFHSADVFASAF